MIVYVTGDASPMIRGELDKLAPSEIRIGDDGDPAGTVARQWATVHGTRVAEFPARYEGARKRTWAREARIVSAVDGADVLIAFGWREDVMTDVRSAVRAGVSARVFPTPTGVVAR